MSKQTMRFCKMHGLGNDFIVIEDRSNTITGPNNFPIQRLADRHIGIGFDQLLVIQASSRADFFCRIFNADGSEAEQCGNGLRCVARYVHETGLHPTSQLTIETKAGLFPIVIPDYEHIQVTLGVPIIENNSLSLSVAPQETPLALSILSMGNPHAILKIDSIESIEPSTLGPQIASHHYFPQGINVGFMEIIDQEQIRLRTFERGVGETFACGSNACAAVAAGIANGWLNQQVSVHFRYGSLTIKWAGPNHALIMTGPADTIFNGEILL